MWVKTGTKSVIYGGHQFLIHPFTVLLAYIELYGFPNWKVLVCIFIHDLGYLGVNDMEGKQGELHPMFGAKTAHKYLDRGHELYYYNFCLYHSRTLAYIHNTTPSLLCWADKLSIKYERWWTYLPRAVLSGEAKEYRQIAINSKLIPNDMGYIEWFKWAQERMVRKAYSQDVLPPFKGE